MRTAAQEDSELASKFRRIMRRIASTVALITARDMDGQPRGLAATTANSLSFDPPSMVVCVNRDASAFPAIEYSKAFCVNLLSTRERAILDLFADGGSRHLRFGDERWSVGPAGLPYLAGAPACVFCRTDGFLDYGSHRVLVGRIDDIVTSGDTGDPLVWLASGVCRAVPLDGK